LLTWQNPKNGVIALKRSCGNLVCCLFFVVFSSVQDFAQVDTAWVRSYDGPISFSDVPTAMKVDVLGNVYVTGESESDTGNYDFATVKYYPNGDVAWVARYDGPENSTDEPKAIIVDVLGNVYVTGITVQDTLSNNMDYVTIKYYPNGDTVWIRTYNGPGNRYDYAYALAVDNSGNVYVTGVSYGNETYEDYATIKYDSLGNELWIRRYNRQDDDWAYDIAVDGLGNVYVTGTSGTVKYDTNGNELWVGSWGGVDIVLNDYGNVYVTGNRYTYQTSLDYLTVEYYPNGDTGWVRIYNGPIGYKDDRAVAIAVDPLGNVYVTGQSYGIGTENDYTTIKYSPSGDQLWVERYNGTGNKHDYVNGIAIDNSARIYVTGTTKSTGPYYDWDYATVKYDQNGNQLWVEKYNGTGDNSDGAVAMAVDSSYSVYVTGYSTGISTGIDYTTIRYIQPFTCGDANHDGVMDIGDVVYLINYLYKNGPAPNRLEAGDTNSDGIVDVGDVVYLINYLFKGGPAPNCT